MPSTRDQGERTDQVDDVVAVRGIVGRMRVGRTVTVAVTVVASAAVLANTARMAKFVRHGMSARRARRARRPRAERGPQGVTFVASLKAAAAPSWAGSGGGRRRERERARKRERERERERERVVRPRATVARRAGPFSGARGSKVHRTVSFLSCPRTAGIRRTSPAAYIEAHANIT